MSTTTGPPMNGSALLSARGITKCFEGIQALDDVPLEVGPGECVGLIGPNGAGKTTLFDCLTGHVEPDEGTVRFRGRKLGKMSGVQRAQMGLARTFQRVEMFPGMTVGEHLMVAVHARSRRSGLWRDLTGRGRVTDDDRRRVEAILSMLGLRDDIDRPVESLPLGKLRLVELGRALACEPVLLLLDEPSSGLDRRESTAMAEVLEEVRERSDVAILLIEHDVPLVRRLADRLEVLDAGRLVAEGPTDEVLANPKVQTAYLGSESSR
jgi:branched-chain amino acid transport system ATP-binding protein